MAEKIVKTDAEWKAQLTPDQYRVARKGGTEPAFRNAYHAEKKLGTYQCVCCGADLFSSKDKFDSGTGWPSFTRPVVEGAVASAPDHAHGMMRVEVLCARCDAHLGHVFDDGPRPTGQRFCMNSTALSLVPKK